MGSNSINNGPRSIHEFREIRNQANPTDRPKGLLKPGVIKSSSHRSLGGVRATMDEVAQKVPLFDKLSGRTYAVDLSTSDGKDQLRSDLSDHYRRHFETSERRTSPEATKGEVKMGGQSLVKLPKPPSSFGSWVKNGFGKLFGIKSWTYSGQHIDKIKGQLPDIRENAKRAMLTQEFGSRGSSEILQAFANNSRPQLQSTINQSLAQAGLSGDDFANIRDQISREIYDGYCDGAVDVLSDSILKQAQLQYDNISDVKTNKMDAWFNNERQLLGNIQDRVWVASRQTNSPEAFKKVLDQTNRDIDQLRSRIDDKERENWDVGDNVEAVDERRAVLEKEIRNLTTDVRHVSDSFDLTHKLLYDPKQRSAIAVQKHLQRFMSEKPRSGESIDAFLERTYDFSTKQIQGIQKEVVDKQYRLTPSHWDELEGDLDDFHRQIDGNRDAKETLLRGEAALTSSQSTEDLRKLVGSGRHSQLDMLIDLSTPNNYSGFLQDGILNEELKQDLNDQAIELRTQLRSRNDVLKQREALANSVEELAGTVSKDSTKFGESLETLNDLYEGLAELEKNNSDVLEGLPPKAQLMKHARAQLICAYLKIKPGNDDLANTRFENLFDRLDSKGVLTADFIDRVAQLTGKNDLSITKMTQELFALESDSRSFDNICEFADKLYADEPDKSLALKLRFSPVEDQSKVQNQHFKGLIDENLQGMLNNTKLKRLIAETAGSTPRNNQQLLSGLVTLVQSRISTVSGMGSISDFKSLAADYEKLASGKLLPSEDLSKLLVMAKSLSKMKLASDVFDQARANRLLEGLATALVGNVDIHSSDFSKQIKATLGDSSGVMEELNKQISSLDLKRNYAKQGIKMLDGRLHASLQQLGQRIGKSPEETQKLLLKGKVANDLESLAQIYNSAQELQNPNLTNDQRSMHKETIKELAKDLRYFNANNLNVESPGLLGRVVDFFNAPPPNFVMKRLTSQGGESLADKFVEVWKDMTTIRALEKSMVQFEEHYNELVEEKEDLMDDTVIFQREQALRLAVVSAWRDSGESLSTFAESLSEKSDGVLDQLKTWGFTSKDFPELGSQLESIADTLDEELVATWENDAQSEITEIKTKWEKFENSIGSVIREVDSTGSLEVFGQLQKTRQEAWDRAGIVLSNISTLNNEKEIGIETTDYGNTQLTETLVGAIQTFRSAIENMGDIEDGDAYVQLTFKMNTLVSDIRETDFREHDVKEAINEIVSLLTVADKLAGYVFGAEAVEHNFLARVEKVGEKKFNAVEKESLKAHKAKSRKMRRSQRPTLRVAHDAIISKSDRKKYRIVRMANIEEPPVSNTLRGNLNMMNLV